MKVGKENELNLKLEDCVEACVEACVEDCMEG